MTPISFRELSSASSTGLPDHAAAVLGYFINSSEVGALIGALVGAAVSAAILRTYDNVLGRIIDTKATIISIVRDDEDER